MSFINRAVLRRQREATKKDGPEATSITSSIAHPYRALPPGKTWIGHCGKQAAARFLRQQRAKEAKQLRKKYGSSVVQGVDPESGGLLLDFPEPARAK